MDSEEERKIGQEVASLWAKIAKDAPPQPDLCDGDENDDLSENSEEEKEEDDSDDKGEKHTDGTTNITKPDGKAQESTKAVDTLKVFVGRVPASVSRADLELLFSSCGHITFESHVIKSHI